MASNRYQLVDLTRGLAFVAMVLYHGSWFADDYGLVDLDLHGNLGWVVFQKGIAGTFFFLVGSSLYLAHRRGIRAGPFAWRMAKLGACAAVVTVTSIVLNPTMIVSFGILHCIMATSVAALAVLRFGRANAVLGPALIAVGLFVRHPLFDAAGLHWTGLGPTWRATFDFQPFLPWFGVVVLGVAAGQFLWPRTASWASERLAARPLAFLGRQALWLYMAHVPLLIGLMELVRWCGT